MSQTIPPHPSFDTSQFCLTQQTAFDKWMSELTQVFAGIELICVNPFAFC
jgi:hypothetical protein